MLLTAAGLALLLGAWLAFSVVRHSTFTQTSAEGQVAAQPLATLPGSISAPAPNARESVQFPVPPPSAQAPLVQSPGFTAHAPAAATPGLDGLSVVAAGPQTEPVLNSADLHTPALPLGGPHVPFLQSAMAAAGPGASQFGNAYGGSTFAGGGFGAGSLGGGGAAVPSTADAATETAPAGSGNERVGLLGTRWPDETSSGHSGLGDGSSNDGGSADSGSNHGGSGNGGSGDGGSGDGGSNSGDSNNGGSNNGGSNDGSSNGGDSNDGDSEKQGDVPPVGGPGSLPELGAYGFADPGDYDLTDNLGNEGHGEEDNARLSAREVPEPASILLTGLAVAGALGRRVRTRRG